MRIKNWSKFQHYKDRKPPWLRLYTDLLNDAGYHALTPLAAKYLSLIWIVSAEDDDTRQGLLPDSKTLAFRLRLSSAEFAPILDELARAGFVRVDNSEQSLACSSPLSREAQDASAVLAKPEQVATPEQSRDRDRDRAETEQSIKNTPLAEARPSTESMALVVAGAVHPRDADAAAAYAHWRREHTRADPALDKKSRGYRHALKRLKDGRSLADLRAAIDGCHASDWNRENHKDSFEFIMREDQFFAFMERGYAPNKPKGWVAQTQAFLDEQLANLEPQHAG